MRRRCLVPAIALFGVAGCLASLDLDDLQRGCPTGEKACDGACVDQGDPAFGCAAEGCEPCPGPTARLRCDGDGECALSPCRAGEKECDDDCVPEDDPAYGCAAADCAPCSTAHGNAACGADGSCVAESCDIRYKLCDGQCVDVTSPLYGCNRIGCDPCTLPYATAVCSPLGECIIASCAERRGDCDEKPSNGCEANLNEDVNNCGQCDDECAPLPNAEVTCGGANCVVRMCSPGWGNCNANPVDGCETDLMTSSAHCGECGAACTDGQTCVGGLCT